MKRAILFFTNQEGLLRIGFNRNTPDPYTYIRYLSKEGDAIYLIKDKITQNNFITIWSEISDDFERFCFVHHRFPDHKDDPITRNNEIIQFLSNQIKYYYHREGTHDEGAPKAEIYLSIKSVFETQPFNLNQELFDKIWTEYFDKPSAFNEMINIMNKLTSTMDLNEESSKSTKIELSEISFKFQKNG
jgi:hypothetical protein